MLVTSSLDKIVKPNVIALGNFDGIHLGHKQVLKPLFNLNSFIPLLDNQSIYSTVVTFNPHPREFFTGEKKHLLTPLQEKVSLLEELGVNQLLLLPFDRKLACLTPQKFVEEILINKIEAKLISVGEDFRFGNQRKGNADTLKEIASLKKVKVNILKEEKLLTENQQNIRISSSYIRHCLQNGKVEIANKMLGYKYCLTGEVVEGKKLGRTIGFPTANIKVSPNKFLPKKGVYVVKVSMENKPEIKLKGVMNIGCRPTVSGEKITVEVHLLNWSGNLYTQILKVQIEKFLRPEKKFSSLEDLKKQISIDCKLAKSYQF